MEIVNISEAKARWSALIAAAAQGKSFIIAKAGKPLVKVEALETRNDTPDFELGPLSP